MRNSLSRVQFSAFGAAITLLVVMFAINRGRAPSAASASSQAPLIASVSAAPSVPAAVVEADWLAEQLQTNAVITIDARPADQYAAGHIDGAINVPVDLVLDPAPDHSRNVAPIN